MALTAALGIVPAAQAQTKIDLRTTEGVKLVKGQWRYHDVKIVEVDGVGPPPEREKIKTYNIEPHAEKPDYDDSDWEAIDPTTLKNPRANGQVCFCWYRIKITLPESADGKSVHFVTTADDYGEVWVDGQLPRKVGQNGGSIVAGFNAPNRVELKDARAGKTYSIAVFGINGPISAAPGNWIFLRDTFLEIRDKP
jgi:gluconolactonase